MRIIDKKVNNLKRKAVIGILWNLSERFGVQLLNTIVLIVMARLLTPEIFGLVGMVSVFFIVAQALIDSGFGSAYVQKKEVKEIDANTIFYTNLAISIIIFVLLFFIAPAISGFYKEPQLTLIIRVMGIVVIINAFNIIQMAQIKREINFKRSFKATIIASLISGGIGIYTALIGYGVWALVLQQISNRLFITIALWLSSKWKPRLEFSFSVFKEMFSYGAWLALASVLRKLFDNIYVLVIGKFYPIAQVGFYSKAKSMQGLFSNQLTSAISTVSFPVFSELKDNHTELKNAFKKFIQHTMFIIMPLLTLLIVLSKPLVLILLTEKWLNMVLYLQLLCVVGIFYPIFLLNTQIIKTQGKSKIFFLLDLIKNTLRLINIALMYKFGVKFLILGEIIISFLSLVFTSFFSRRLLEYGLIRQFNNIKYTAFGSVLSGIITYFVIVNIHNIIISLFLGIITFILLFVTFYFLLDRKYIFEVMSFKNIFNNSH